MLQFSGNRSRADIKKDVLAAGGTWNDDAYKGGSDWTTFSYQGRVVVYSSFNGKFMVKQGKKYVTEESSEMEKHQWYLDLLNLLYTPIYHRRPSKNKATA